MIYPQEIEVWYVLPSIRRELSKELIRLGLTQKETALKLGITESAISQYIKDKRASEIKFDENILKKIRLAAKKIAKGKSLMREITLVNDFMKKNKFLCQIHHKYDKNLPKECDVCLYEK